MSIFSSLMSSINGKSMLSGENGCNLDDKIVYNILREKMRMTNLFSYLESRIQLIALMLYSYLLK